MAETAAAADAIFSASQTRLIERGPMGIVARKFLHKNSRGCRVPGFEEIDISKLAGAMGLTGQHFRYGFTGRPGARYNLGVRKIMQAADLLGLTMAEWGARVDYNRAASHLEKPIKTPPKRRPPTTEFNKVKGPSEPYPCFTRKYEST